jgi:hypothetical protein
MTVDFFYKGLMEENQFFPYTPEQSADRAQGTMYEAWFDALKASPWYMSMCKGDAPPSEQALECFEKFGDLRNYTFKKWWLDIGYKLFAEKTRYQGVQLHDANTTLELRYNNRTNQLNNLLIEVPINIHPRMLRAQIEEILAQHSRYYEHKNRFAESDAEVTFARDSKLDYHTIQTWLYVYKAVEKERSKIHAGATLYEICRNLNLRRKLFKDFGEGTIVDDETVKQRAANVASEYYQKALRLMAHATEMRFPCVEDHHGLMTIRTRGSHSSE